MDFERQASQRDRLPDDGSPACRRCSKQTWLLTILPRFGAQPTYHIFNCDGCGYIDWVPQQPITSAAT
jgi:hypothetical protein